MLLTKCSFIPHVDKYLSMLYFISISISISISIKCAIIVTLTGVFNKSDKFVLCIILHLIVFIWPDVVN